jgi:hypothetical protein
MQAAESSDKKRYAEEKWWHRLLRILLMYLPALFVFVFLCLLTWDGARYYTYSYSFESSYAKADGDESNCNIYESSESIGCGELGTPKQFMDKWLSVRGFEKNKRGELMNDAYQQAKKEGFSDFVMAKAVIEEGKTKYKRLTQRDYVMLASGIGWTR